MRIKAIEKDTLLVVPEEELDHHSAQKMRTEIDAKLDRGIKNIIFDFSGLNFMDSSGIGMIMGRYKKVAKLGGKVIIAAPRPQVQRIIDMAGLFRIVQVEPDVKKAIKKL